MHGRFPSEVKVEGDNIVVDGQTIRVTAIKNPAELPHKALGVDIALECTGIFTAKDKASAHLQAGAKRVLVSAPAEGADLTVVYGVNHDKLTKEHLVVSNASCTTNCLAPVAKVLHDAVGIERGFMTTVHSYTNDQPSLDQMHKDLYRARAAALNMIPTSTGAAKAVGLVLPDLNGKLDGSSIRVPTPNVSVIDFKFIAKRATTKDEINEAITRAAEQQLKGILGYTNAPNVSSDFNHDPRSSVFHLDQTKVMDGTFVRVMSWYDNEWGFSNRMADTAVAMAKLSEERADAAFRTLDQADVKGKRALVRVDLNVPMENGRVTDATRIERVVPTIKELAEKGAKVILLAHFGRPKGRDAKDSPEAGRRSAGNASRQGGGFRRRLRRRDRAEGGGGAQGRRCAASREHPLPCRRGEERQGVRRRTRKARRHFRQRCVLGRPPRPRLDRGTCTRASGLRRTRHAGELDALTKGLEAPARPVVAIVGGAKVSTKIDLLENLVRKVDALVIGGGMANTFLHAMGLEIGKSLAEKDLADTALRIMERARESQCAIILPVDGVCAYEFKPNAQNHTYGIDAIPEDQMILDVGSQSVERINSAINDAATVVWNGPLGAFEIAPFDQGTVATALHAAERTRAGRLVSVAGGGDTVAALNHAGVADSFTYVSTAGGAFLEWLEGKALPGVEALRA